MGVFKSMRDLQKQAKQIAAAIWLDLESVR